MGISLMHGYIGSIHTCGRYQYVCIWAYTHLCHAHTHIGCINDKRLHPSASRRGRGGCPRPHGSGAAAAVTPPRSGAAGIPRSPRMPPSPIATPHPPLHPPGSAPRRRWEKGGGRRGPRLRAVPFRSQLRCGSGTSAPLRA